LDSDLKWVMDILDAMKRGYAADVLDMTSWECCVGSLDPSDFYERIGMPKRASVLRSHRLARRTKKYWENQTILIYHRQ
jgi:hypothetical protein